MDIICRFDPDFEPPAPPRTSAEAIERLQHGNEEFIRLSTVKTEKHETHLLNLPPSYFYLSRPPGTVPEQEPFAVVLGCSDARVPTEIVFNQPRNHIFAVRVAGNVLGPECLGSIEYAATHLTDHLRLVAVLGHSSCGAVTAAVDAFLDPARYLDIASSQALRAVIDRISTPVLAASRTLQDLWGPDVVDREGYRAALIDASAAFNAALTAWTIRAELPQSSLDRVGVVFGVFDLLTHRVRSPSLVGSPEISPGLAAAPTDRESLRELGRVVGQSEAVRTLLGV